MWTINQVEQSSPFGGVLEMSHREKPRSGRGCFGAVVVVPFLALGGLFALIAFVGGPAGTPLVAPPPVQPTTSQWWTEPFETGVALSTVTETVVVERAARAARSGAAAPASTRVSVAMVTETVRASPSVVKPSAAGRNEPAPSVEESEPVVPSAPSPAGTTSSAAVSTVEAPPPVEAPSSSSPRAERPVPVVITPVEPPAERAEPSSADPIGTGAARGWVALYRGTLARA